MRPLRVSLHLFANTNIIPGSCQSFSFHLRCNCAGEQAGLFPVWRHGDTASAPGGHCPLRTIVSGSPKDLAWPEGKFIPAMLKGRGDFAWHCRWRVPACCRGKLFLWAVMKIFAALIALYHRVCVGLSVVRKAFRTPVSEERHGSCLKLCGFLPWCGRR